MEVNFQKRLLEFYKSMFLSKQEDDRIQPEGSQRPRMYGLSKIHKRNVQLSSILCMVGFVQHELAKWSVESS